MACLARNTQTVVPHAGCGAEEAIGRLQHLTKLQLGLRPALRSSLFGGIFGQPATKLKLRLLGCHPAATDGSGGSSEIVRRAALQHLVLACDPQHAYLDGAELFAGAAAMTDLRQLCLAGLDGKASATKAFGPGLAALSLCSRLQDIRLRDCNVIDSPAVMHLAAVSSLTSLSSSGSTQMWSAREALQAAFLSRYRRPLSIDGG